MKKRYLFLCLVLLGPSFFEGAFAQIPIYRQFNVGFSAGTFKSVQPHPGGGYMVLAQANTFVDGETIVLFRLSETGDSLWTKTYKRGNLDNRWPVDMSVAQDGFYILTAKRGNNGYASFEYNAVMKVDLQGDSLWDQNLTSQADWAAAGLVDVETTRDGGCLVAGAGSGWDQSPIILKLSGTGEMEWMNAGLPGGAYTRLNKVVESDDGSIFSCGYHSAFRPTANDSRLLVVKLQTDGSPVWAKTYFSGRLEVGDSIRSEGFDVWPDGNGGCLVAGYMTEPGIYNGPAMIMHLDEEGDIAGMKRYFSEPSRQATAFRLLPAQDNNLLVFLHRNTGFTSAEATLMKINLEGDSLWTQRGYDYRIYLRDRASDGSLLFSGYAWPGHIGVFIRTTPDGMYSEGGIHVPFDGMTELTAPVLLKWDPNGSYQNPVRYHLQVAKDQSFSNLVLENANIRQREFSFDQVESQTTYFWRMRNIGSEGGAGLWSPTFRFTTAFFTGVGERDKQTNGVSVTFRPNPFHGYTSLDLSLNSPEFVFMHLYNSTGGLVKTVNLGYRVPGIHEINLDLRDVPSGIYNCRIVGGNSVKVVRIINLK